MGFPEEKYTSNDYLAHNPSWDSGDSPWKASAVHGFIRDHDISPNTVCEIGCGAGGVLAKLAGMYPEAEFFGYDIAPAAATFWKEHTAKNLRFQVGDFFKLNKTRFDLALLLDVVEHVRDPFAFLAGLHGTAENFLFHIPLDLNSFSIARETPILLARRQVGHINYFTKTLALELLSESGFAVLDWKYSGSAFSSPQSTLKTRLAALPRFLAYSINKDFGVRLLGGETLWVLVRSSKDIAKL